MPRVEIQLEISSDNGSAFIQKTEKCGAAVTHQTAISLFYHSQSQGKVDKNEQHFCKCKLNWVDALPLTLMIYRMQANRMTHLSLHEMLTGRPMLSPTFRGPHKGPPLEQLEIKLKKYIRQLTSIQKLILYQEKDRVPEPEDEPPRGVEPDDQLYLRCSGETGTSPRWTGPYRVTERTSHAVRLDGKGET